MLPPIIQVLFIIFIICHIFYIPESFREFLINMKPLGGHFQFPLFTFTEMYSTDSASFLSMLQSVITLILKKFLKLYYLSLIS